MDIMLRNGITPCLANLSVLQLDVKIMCKVMERSQLTQSTRLRLSQSGNDNNNILGL